MKTLYSVDGLQCHLLHVSFIFESPAAQFVDNESYMIILMGAKGVIFHVYPQICVFASINLI